MMITRCLMGQDAPGQTAVPNRTVCVFGAGDTVKRPAGAPTSETASPTSASPRTMPAIPIEGAARRILVSFGITNSFHCLSVWSTLGQQAVAEAARSNLEGEAQGATREQAG